jgi:hypothetical protein
VRVGGGHHHVLGAQRPSACGTLRELWAQEPLPGSSPSATSPSTGGGQCWVPSAHHKEVAYLPSGFYLEGISSRSAITTIYSGAIQKRGFAARITKLTNIKQLVGFNSKDELMKH